MSENVKKHVVLCGSILGNKGTLLGWNYHFLVMNDHFGGSSVHCGQILQKLLARGRAPPFLAMPGLWVHTVLRNPEAARGNVHHIPPCRNSGGAGACLIALHWIDAPHLPGSHHAYCKVAKTCILVTKMHILEFNDLFSGMLFNGYVQYQKIIIGHAA